MRKSGILAFAFALLTSLLAMGGGEAPSASSEKSTNPERALREKQGLQTFKLADKDRDGYLSFDELKNAGFWRELVANPGVFAKVDKDGDGKLSLEECQMYRKARYDSKNNKAGGTASGGASESTTTNAGGTTSVSTVDTRTAKVVEARQRVEKNLVGAGQKRDALRASGR